jgi:endo-1,4-beta-xylanase
MMIRQTGKRVAALFLTLALLLTCMPAFGATDTVYHETFADGAGVAVQSGGASLTQVTGQVFDGNEDGAALSVANRANSWDAADFTFSALGLETGATYAITVQGFVAADATVPAGAKAVLGTNQTYQWLSNVEMKAGEAFTLTAEYTVGDADTALRLQSSDEGATVPFLIGEVAIMGQAAASADEVPARPAAKAFATITFEDNTANGFAGRAGTEVLTVAEGEDATGDGSHALKVEGRTTSWHGPALRVEQYIDLGNEYTISAWVKLVSPDSADLQLSTQVGDGSGASYLNLDKKTVAKADGWVQLLGKYRYTSVGEEFVTVYLESGNAEAAFLLDDVSLVGTGTAPVSVQKDLKSIKDVYADDFLIGTAGSGKDFEGVRFELLKKHFNVVTAENAMKPGELQPTKGVFTFDAADSLIEKSLAVDVAVHGHVLVWHQQSPDWMNTSGTGDAKVALSREEALENLQTHITTVMEHFGDKVISWDVVNEAMNDNPSNPENWKGALRQSQWYQAIGGDYVEQAFLAARAVLDAHPDWDVKLYYNDYNLDNQNKAAATHAMVKELNEAYAANHAGKMLIDGVGMQGHYTVNTNPANVALSLERFLSLGVEVSITELDIQAGSNYELTDKLANAQGYQYAQLFKLFRDNADHIARVTLWGMDDGNSWRAEGNPLVFDKDLQAKVAFDGVIDPDAFIAANQPDTTDAKRGTATFGTPVVDGVADAAWDKAVAMDVNQYQMAWQGATGTAKVMWDEKSLYVLLQVSDAQLDKTSANAWEQDSVEVFLDENNGKTSFYQDDDGQFRVNYDNEASFNPAAISEGFASATVVSGTSYTVEMMIPLRTMTAKAGLEIGFDAQINDGKDGARQSVAAWNDTTGNGYQDTSVYGILTLVEADDAMFSDLADAAWAKEAVEALVAETMMAGISNTSFGVAEPITRGDFLASLIKVLKLDAQADKNFADVKEDAPYAAEIAIAKELGIALGMGCNRFMPDKAITRQDMMVLVDRAFAQAGIPMTVDASVTLEAFADAAQVAGYAKDSVAKAVVLGLVAEKEGKLNPLGTTTRAEAAVLLYGILTR